MKRYEA